MRLAEVLRTRGPARSRFNSLSGLAIPSSSHRPRYHPGGHQTAMRCLVGPHYFEVGERTCQRADDITNVTNLVTWWAAVDSNHLPPRYHWAERCADGPWDFNPPQHNDRCYQAC